MTILYALLVLIFSYYNYNSIWPYYLVIHWAIGHYLVIQWQRHLPIYNMVWLAGQTASPPHS